jgi:hypothetical protein
MTQEQHDSVFELGKLGFAIKDVALLLEMPEKEVFAQFTDKKGEIYSAYTAGRIQGKVDIRRTIQASALNSSSPALEKMLEFFKKSEYDNMEIWEE